MLLEIHHAWHGGQIFFFCGLKNFKVMDGRTIRIYDLRISASEIAKELALNEVELISIGRKSESLEEYFLKMTGEGERHV